MPATTSLFSASSAQRPRSGKALPGDGISPSRKRVTRSQSREIEVASANDGLRYAESSHDGSANGDYGEETRKINYGGGADLGVIEESPAKPLHNGIRSSRRLELESFEDPANISGTTVLPTDSESDTEGLDPIMVIEALPDLQRAATGVLDFLIPQGDSVAIVSNAQRLRDSKNTQSRRLKRFVTNLETEAESFGFQKYVDVNGISSSLPPIFLDGPAGQKDKWDPTPIVHKANCARLAIEVLFAGAVGADSPQQVIKVLMEQFPLPFVAGFSTRGKRGDGAGSSLERETFYLELDICTQYLRMELNARQHKASFNPETVLHKVFFNNSSSNEVETGQPPLYSLNTSPFEDESGNLEEHFKEAVHDRVYEIRESLGNFDDAVDLQNLNSDYRWQKFVHRVARWLQKRDKEISQVLKRQPSLDDVRNAVEKELKGRSSLGGKASQNEYRDQTAEINVPHHSNSSVTPAENKERRKSKGVAFRNTFAIERVTEMLRSATEISEPRRHSDSAGLMGQRASPSWGRRQTLPAKTVSQQPIEIPASPEADRTSLRPSAELEDDYVPVIDSHSDVGNSMVREAERSHSPPMRPASTQPTPRLPRAPMRDIQRKTFIDRQKDAYRVSPISQAGSADPKDKWSNARSKRKRAIFDYDDDYNDESEDEDEDEFSRDERAVDVAGKRAQKPEQPQRKRQRVDDDDDAAERPSFQLQRSLQESTVSASAPAGEVGRIRSRLPAHVESNAYPKGTLYRSQKRWSEEENRRLIHLIGLFGTHWAKIKRQDDVWSPKDGGPKLSDREQMQIKDRARNMLLSFLRNGETLPPNFDQVTIKAVDRKKLERQGVEIPINLGSKTPRLDADD